MAGSKGLRCGAQTRQGRPCVAKAMENGRCRNHGGMSTGPKTVNGKARALANLRQFTTTSESYLDAIKSARIMGFDANRVRY